MSSPVLTSPQPQAYQRPRPDLFTALLALALVALIGAIVLLYLEMQRFEFELQAPPPAAGSPQPAPPGHAAWSGASGVHGLAHAQLK